MRALWRGRSSADAHWQGAVAVLFRLQNLWHHGTCSGLYQCECPSAKVKLPPPLWMKGVVASRGVPGIEVAVVQRQALVHEKDQLRRGPDRRLAREPQEV